MEKNKITDIPENPEAAARFMAKAKMDNMEFGRRMAMAEEVKTAGLKYEAMLEEEAEAKEWGAD